MNVNCMVTFIVITRPDNTLIKAVELEHFKMPQTNDQAGFMVESQLSQP